MSKRAKVRKVAPAPAPHAPPPDPGPGALRRTLLRLRQQIEAQRATGTFSAPDSYAGYLSLLTANEGRRLPDPQRKQAEKWATAETPR
jgi:hypothetical protein